MVHVTLTGGGEAVTARPLCVSLVRRIGQAVRLSAAVAARPTEDWLEEKITAGPVRIAVGSGLHPDAVLSGPDAVRTRPDGALVLTAVATRAEVPFGPDRHHSRVRTGDTLHAVVAGINAAHIPDAVAKRLATIKLGEGRPGSILQAGLSDLDAVRTCLGAYADLEPADPARAITLTGGVGDGTAGRWVATWRDPAAYARFEQPGARAVRFADGDGFPGKWGVPLSPWRGAGVHPPAVVVKARLQRRFTPEAWTAWATRDLPLTLGDGDGGFVVGVTDELVWPGPAWHTALELAPTAVGLPGEADPLPSPAWSGSGRAVADATRSERLEVELLGFAQGEDRLAAGMVTASDGAAGDTGIHAPIAAGSEVELAWSGKYGDPVQMFGNRRRKPALAPPPFVAFDALFTARLGSVLVETIGAVRIRSDLVATIGGKFSVRAEVVKVESNRAVLTIDEYVDGSKK